MTEPTSLPDSPAPPQVLEIRGHSVILDADVADLFQVETRSLNQQVHRNPLKFEGFAFRLSESEAANLRS